MPHPHARITAYLEDKVAAVQETDAALAAEWDTIRDLYTRKYVPNPSLSLSELPLLPSAAAATQPTNSVVPTDAHCLGSVRLVAPGYGIS